MPTTSEQLRDRRDQQRTTAYNRQMERVHKDDSWSEGDLVFDSYTDGWNDGYRAGFQTALDVVKLAYDDKLKALRASLLANGPI
jgi:hypothetical protein